MKLFISLCLFISLTDKQGWSTQKGISIKIFHKLEE